MTIKTHNVFTDIMLIACIISLCGVASAATTVSVLPSVEIVAPGEEFTLNVYVKPDTQIAALQFDLNPDCSLVTIENVEEGGLFSSTGSPFMFNEGSSDITEGSIRDIHGILMADSSTAEEGTFCTIKLIAAEETGNCQIKIENIIVGDKNGNELDAITYDAMVSISDEIENTNRDNDNDDDTELNIVVVQDDDTSSPVDEETATAVEETTLQSVQDTTENIETQGSTAAPEAESSTSKVGILAIAAIAFMALAFVLDRKRK